MSREIIRRAADAIKDPKNWVTGGLVLNRKGKPARTFWGGEAARYDILGAVLAQGRQTPGDIRRDGVDDNKIIVALAGVQQAATRIHKMSAERVNDELGHAAVMGVLRLAWKQATEEE